VVEEALALREVEHRARQVVIGRAAVGEQTPDHRQQPPEVEQVEGAQRRERRHRELEHDQPAAGAEDRRQLRERAIEVGHVAQPESHGRGGEAPGGERQGERVGGERPRQRRGGSGQAAELAARQRQHRQAEVPRRHPRAPPAQGDGLIAGAAAEVQHKCARGEVERRGCAAAPDQVEPGRQQVVEQIVAPRHLGEHVADRAARLVETAGRLGGQGAAGRRGWADGRGAPAPRSRGQVGRRRALWGCGEWRLRHGRSIAGKGREVVGLARKPLAALCGATAKLPVPSRWAERKHKLLIR
jgi:hypothetical protein